MLLKSTVSLIIFIFSNCNAYIIYTSLLEDNLKNQVVCFGDLHNLNSKDQIEYLNNKFNVLFPSQAYKNGLISIYYEGLSYRKEFASLVLNNQTHYNKILLFIYLFDKTNNKNFVDIDLRRHLNMTDLIYDEIKLNGNVYTTKIYNLLELLIKEIASDLNYIDKKLDSLYKSKKLNEKAFSLLKNQIDILYKKWQTTQEIEKAKDIKTSVKFYENKFSVILDIACVLAIVENNKAKKHLIFTGLLHIDFIETILIYLGYFKKYNSNNPEILLTNLTYYTKHPPLCFKSDFNKLILQEL